MQSTGDLSSEIAQSQKTRHTERVFLELRCDDNKYWPILSVGSYF